MQQTQPDIGSTANSYAILAKLATGGMAEIFLARTESAAGVERYVVLKRVLQHRATDIKFVNMFLDEARLAAQLQHPNIAQVYDTGKLGDSYFFTMEYVHGETVRELLHRAYAVGQAIPIGCALTIAMGAAAGLQHAHERVSLDGKPLGIVHRDVSPSNLMISYEGNIKVVDFGVAKAAHRSIETQSGTVKGKIGYMSPEQCRGGIVDQRCDLFCLGIVMWELLVGERLFKRATDFESMEAIVGEASPAPSSRRPDLPKELDTIVLKLLEKSPDDRYQTADELLEAIEQVAVHAKISLSVPALRRFVRELFGQRPEPWVEMRIRDTNPEVVTVTGAPLIAKGEVTVELVDQQLNRLVDLSGVSIPPVPPPPPLLKPRAPTSPTASAPLPTFPHRKETPSEELRRPSSRFAITPEPSSGSNPSARLAISSPLVTTDKLPHVKTRNRWLTPVILAVIGIIAVVIIVDVLRSPTRDPVASGPGSVTGSAGAIATLEVDASVAEPPPADARVTVAKPDAAVDVKPPKPNAGSATPRPRALSKQEELNAAFNADRFADAVAHCTATPRLALTNAATCTLAACREHETEKARKWLQKVPAAKHGLIVDTCEVFGTPLVVKEPEPPKPPKPPPPKPKCDPNDPMSCRTDRQ